MNSVASLWSPDELLPARQCPACAAPPSSTKVADRADGLGIKRCPRCSLLYIDPVPSEAALARCYGPNYYAAGNGGQIGYASNDVTSYHGARRTELVAGGPLGFREIVESLDLRGKAVLEIGCADGALLASLKKLGASRLVGIDINETALAMGRRLYDLDLRQATLDTAGFEDGEFDYVLMIDVIEHVPALAEFMSAAARCFRRGGAMVVFCPNAAGLEFAGNHWAYLGRSLEHVTYPCVKSLEWLAAELGLRIYKAWSEGNPERVRQYQKPQRPRLFRILSEPGVAVGNAFSRARLSRARTGEVGLDLRVFMRKND